MRLGEKVKIIGSKFPGVQADTEIGTEATIITHAEYELLWTRGDGTKIMPESAFRGGQFLRMDIGGCRYIENCYLLSPKVYNSKLYKALK